MHKKFECKNGCSIEIKTHFQLADHKLVCPKKKPYKELVLLKRGLVERQVNEAEGVENEAEGVVNVIVAPVVSEDPVSFEMRKVPKKIEKRIEREKREVERKKNKKRPIDLSHK